MEEVRAMGPPPTITIGMEYGMGIIGVVGVDLKKSELRYGTFKSYDGAALLLGKYGGTCGGGGRK